MTKPQSKMTRDELRQALEEERQRALALQQQLESLEDKKMVVINTRMTMASRDRLKEIAQRESTTMKSLIQKAVDTLIDDYDRTKW